MSLDRDKLSKILAMLSSNHDGERLAAVNRATSMLQAAGMRWEEVAKAPPGSGGIDPEKVADLVQENALMKRLYDAEVKKTDEFRSSIASKSREIGGLKRDNRDLTARLEIAQAENAKLRKALGPDQAARAVFGDLAATVFGEARGEA